MKPKATWFIIGICAGANVLLGCSKESSTVQPAKSAARRSVQQIRIQEGRMGPRKVVPPHDEGRPTIPTGIGPFVRVLRNGEPVTNGVYEGRVTQPEKNRLLLVLDAGPHSGDTISIGFALPAGLSLPSVNDRVTLTVRDSSSLQGAHQEVLLCSETKPLIAFIWKTMSDTLKLDVSCGMGFSPVISLAQVSQPFMSFAPSDSVRGVEVRIGNSNNIAPVGKVFSILNGQYSGFIRTSVFKDVSDKGRDVRRGYIMRAIVARTN